MHLWEVQHRQDWAEPISWLRPTNPPIKRAWPMNCFGKSPLWKHRQGCAASVYLKGNPICFSPPFELCVGPSLHLQSWQGLLEKPRGLVGHGAQVCLRGADPDSCSPWLHARTHISTASAPPLRSLLSPPARTSCKPSSPYCFLNSFHTCFLTSPPATWVSARLCPQETLPHKPAMAHPGAPHPVTTPPPLHRLPHPSLRTSHAPGPQGSHSNSFWCCLMLLWGLPREVGEKVRKR